ncbi:MAG: CBM35 domain-containing protein, partial [Bacteroidota bacterium]|nr:CBM35 domain-containing protein [Bacteroidota bacterium]
MKKIILAISVLLVAGALHFSFGQALNINLKAEKDCNTKIFSATIQLYIDTGSNLKIGNSSILLSFNDDALIFNSYQALHFNGSDQCAGIGISAWDVHKFDDVSYPDQFHLALSLADTNFSCPVISYPDTIDVGIIYFDIVQQGANPFVYIDTGATWFNSDIPNNGSGMLTTGNIASIDTAGILLCDCPGMGEPCDDNNVLTVDDKYDNYCNCFGEYLDSDQDGILDGIDPCTDIIYEAEEADMASVEIWNNYYQFTGSGFINYLHSTGDSVWFTILPADTGTYTLGFRYSLGYGSRPLKLTIDGTEIVSSFDFPSTGSWSAWDTIVYSYYFQPGYHTVLLTTIGYEGPMLDHLKLSICTGCQTSGIVCDDSDPCTTNDLIDANCNCEGIYLDTDNDGVCNTFDICEGGDDFLDTDLDGIPDFCDACDNNLIGTSCNDGNPCTSNDTLNAACICEGVFNGPDTDGDGVCDAFDLCPGGDDNFDFDLDGIPDFCDTCNNLLLGLPCDDGNPCTILDVYDTTCICVGVYVDTDNDGVCDMLDQCEGFADSLDIDADGIPDACDNCNNLFIGLTCDDGDTCTYNDVITADCECVGEYFDTDYDGVCDIFDLCLGFADSIDNDGDAIPNACDNCYDLVYQAEDMYYSSSAIPGIGANATGSGYVRFTNNIDTIIFNVMAVDTGMVSISIRYAQADTGKTGLIEVDGQTLFENFAYPKVYDEWDVWDRVQFNIYFSEGPHT